MKEKIIKETTEKLSNGTITKDEADKILLDLLVVRKRCHNQGVLEGWEHCFICTFDGCQFWH